MDWCARIAGRGRLVLASLTLIGLLASGSFQSVHAQLAPEIGYAHPAGGRAGETVEITLGGR